MEIHEPGFWTALVIGLFCLAIFVLWLCKGGLSQPSNDKQENGGKD